MSRLAALKEFAFMKILKENSFPVPEPIANSRHTIVMELIDAFPLRQISSVPNPAVLYAELIEIILRLASHGLIHGDFNEFNILIKEEDVENPSIKPTTETQDNPTSTSSLNLTPILIDFPQMVSIDHTNAEMYFDRDVDCIKRFFARRFHFTSDESGPSFADARKRVGRNGRKRLDVEVEASGFSKKMAKDLEKYMQEIGVDGDGGDNRDDEDITDEDDYKEIGEGTGISNDTAQRQGGSENMHDTGEAGGITEDREESSVPSIGVSGLSLGNT